MTLTDDDLKELGISTFGARKKMLLTIAGESWPAQEDWFKSRACSHVFLKTRYSHVSAAFRWFALLHCRVFMKFVARVTSGVTTACR